MTRLIPLIAGLCSSSVLAQDLPSIARMPSDHQIVLITGSTDGLGAEVARRLAARGAHVIVHGRNRARGEGVVRAIAASGTGSARFYAADLADLQQVHAFAEQIQRDYDRIDVLVNNAGIWLTRTRERQLSDDGHELHFAVNYLAGYALTHLLLPLIGDGGRIVNVASGAQQPIDFDDPMLTRGYSPGSAYAQSKLAQIMFTFDLAEQLAERGITVVALHPATLMNTPMVEEAGVRARSTVEEGAEAVVRAVTSADVRSGEYYDGTRRDRAHEQAYDVSARARLRALSRDSTGLPQD